MKKKIVNKTDFENTESGIEMYNICKWKWIPVICSKAQIHNKDFSV